MLSSLYLKLALIESRSLMRQQIQNPKSKIQNKKMTAKIKAVKNIAKKYKSKT
jgi:hypothetical protein